MSKIFGGISIVLALCTCTAASAAIWYVNWSASQTGDGTTWASSFKTIQEGINAASDGHEVIVAQGTYVENINFGEKNIILRSTNPLNPNVVANTIIDGNHADSVVTFYGTEGETWILSGFTIRNGETYSGGAGICGGKSYRQARARIENNVITSNSATAVTGDGGGAAYLGGIVQPVPAAAARRSITVPARSRTI